ncbi:MAG: bifunctional folylpolyglutamate synthase/dihydrofolate synthase [Planctomycetota bacterium]|jgi:dihydrofolate synthase/folylpolyglutamate synthase
MAGSTDAIPDAIESALRALSGLTNYERTRADGPRSFDLSRPRRLLENLRSPHLALGTRVVQVAGTKGKGSTARFVASILSAAGLRTGLFTSPHLQQVTERIAIDGKPIGADDFLACVRRAIAAVDTETTFFEALLAAACLHFAESETDAVVLEVGLGGRLDATTAVPSTHNLITEISLDHTEILGTTHREIAAEKAGTIRPAVPVWSGVDPASEAGREIARIARAKEAPLHYVPPPTDVVANADGLSWRGIPLATMGRHQAHNAALAAAACSGLAPDTIAAGLAAAEQPGCCERRGRVILDGAHTVASIEATVQALHDHCPGETPALVLALAQDKDLDGIASALAPRVARIVCTRADDRRGRDAGELAAHAAWQGRAEAVDDPAQALETALGRTDGLVLATGSLYLAGALRGLTSTS